MAALRAEAEGRLRWEDDRRERDFAARAQAIARLGLPEVRRHRERLLEAEREAWLWERARMASAMPSLEAMAVLRVKGKR